MRKIVVVFLAIAMLAGAFVALGVPAAAQTRMGGFADELVFFEQSNTQQAVSDVSAGTNMQLYMFNLRSIADINAALADPNIKTVITPGSVDDMFINPVQNDPSVGGFNPFAIREVREAMHWLIDRDYIVEQIFGGHAVTYTAPYHPLQPDYLRDIVFNQALDRQYSYDPAKARQVIFAALGAVSGMAFAADGKWYYQGAPLTVVFIIRVEDRRLDIGNYVADQLETLGITVDRQYKPASAAFNIVYFGPPNLGFWHIYTEGFGFTALSAWQDNFIATLGWTADSGDAIWDFYTPSAILVDSARRLEFGQYADLAERQSLIRTAETEAMKDPVRLMVVAEQAVFISNKNIAGYVYDLSGGPWTLYSARSARYTSGAGGTIRIGQPVHWNSQWNPYRGFSWLYDETQRRALTDFGVYYHPHTGLYQPIRGAFNVVTSGGYAFPPLSVPTDAVWYNVSANAFQPVGSGITAVSKITWDYTFGPWHDGQAMSMNDVLYELMNVFRRFSSVTWGTLANPFNGTTYSIGDIGMHDRRADSAAAVTFLSLFKGARQVDATHMEIYLDFWHVDNGEIAAIGDIFPTTPWEIGELMAKGVLADVTAYHATTAQTQLKQLLDLIRGASLPILASDLQSLKTATEVPVGMTAQITAAEATARWAALETFSTTTTTVTGQSGYTGGHFYDSNGPYWLKTVDVTSKQDVMDRFANYPFADDKWDAALVPKVPVVQLGAIPEVVPGLPVTIPLSATLFGSPYDNVDLSYLITNPATGAVLFQGSPARLATGSYQIALNADETAAILPGTYNVQVIGVGREAAIPVVDTKSFLAIPTLAYFELQLGLTKADLQTQINQANAAAASANAAALAAADQARSLSNLLTIAVAVAVVAIAISVVSVVMALRRGAGMRPKMPEEPPKESEEI